ncbi:hypothetical protein NDU88_003209 [Pleurodeles waltl]|uniref:Uncharacterized protein n=1 Tax=Pleurodeles waltl TaxID=8319 RepID=A0AAV7RCH7_PLEWA|nr:hypothetical protein NDU88_003209 [Pleurodeles waltl]
MNICRLSIDRCSRPVSGKPKEQKDGPGRVATRQTQGQQWNENDIYQVDSLRSMNRIQKTLGTLLGSVYS